MASLRAHGVRRLNALVHAAREPVFLLDPQGLLAYVNPAWEALTGLPAESVLGRPPERAIPAGEPTAPPAFLPPPEAIRGSPARARALIVTPTGDRLWRRVEFWPHRDASGAILGTFGFVREEEEPAIAPESASLRASSDLLEVAETLRRRHGHASLVGLGPRHERLLAQVNAAALTSSPALLVGEPGTGRKRAARAIHERSASSHAPFLSLDAAALDADTLQRELFDDRADTPHRLRAPEGSTLLIENMSKLPRDVQERLVTSLGVPGVRILGATESDPEGAFRDGRWREDFYYAMSGLVLRLAPLRERPDELPLLAQHFLERANLRGPARRASFTPEALDVLAAYDWPGNLGELARVVDATHARGSGDRIEASDLPAEIRGDLASAYAPPPGPPTVTSLDGWLMRLERRLIEGALSRARQNKSRAAELLDISRPRLYRRIKELNIPEEPESPEETNGRGSARQGEEGSDAAL